MFTRYSVNVGDTLWTALYSRVNEAYSIEGVYEDEAQKFAILKADDKFYRLNFSISDTEEIVFAEEVVEVEGYTPDEEPQFSAEEVQAFVENYNKSEDKDDEVDTSDSEDNSDEENNDEEHAEDEDKTKFGKDEDEEEKCPECGKPVEECTCEDEEEDKKKYNLEEIAEYVELSAQYAALEESYNQLVAEKANLEAQISELAEFKNAAERKNKQEMIDSFYMLSDEDKKDVIDNIDTYSLDDIEAKLSIICVRNKVSFNLDNDKDDNQGPTTYNLNNSGAEDENTPAWVKAALAVAKNKN